MDIDIAINVPEKKNWKERDFGKTINIMVDALPLVLEKGRILTCNITQYWKAKNNGRKNKYR